MKESLSRSNPAMRIISLALVVALVISMAPMGVFADDTPVVVNENNVSEENVCDKDETSTTYQLSSGEVMTVFHGDEVRYENEDGDLVDYDPSLVDITEKETENGRSLDGYVYENKAGDSKQYIPKTLTEDHPIIMEKGDASVSFGLTEDTIQDMQLDGKKVETEEEEIADIYDKVEKKEINATYAGEDASVTYTSEPKSVKETIKLDRAPENNIFKYILKLTGVTPEKSDLDGSISFYDENGELVGGIGVPYMTDAEGNYSESIEYEIEEQMPDDGTSKAASEEPADIDAEEAEEADEQEQTEGTDTADTDTDTEEPSENRDTQEESEQNEAAKPEDLDTKTYILTMTVDKDYLENAAYPVSIDPTTTWKGNSMLTDVLVCNGSNYKKKNYNTSGQTAMKVGKGANGTYRTYIKFSNLASKLKGQSIQSAYMYMYDIGDSNNKQKVTAYRVKASWTPSKITWSNQPGYSTSYGSITSKSKSKKKKYTFTLTSYVKNVAAGSIGDYGIMLKNDSSANKWCDFYGSRHSTSSCRPKLVVTYCSVPSKASSVNLSKTETSNSKEIAVSWTGISSTGLSSTQYAIQQLTDGNWSTVLSYTTLKNGAKITKELPEGTYRVLVRGVNQANVAGSAAYSSEFVVDKTNPTLGGASLKTEDNITEEGDWTKDNNPEICFTSASDNYDLTKDCMEYAILERGSDIDPSYVKAKNVSFTGEDAQAGSFRFSETDQNIKSGSYDIYVRAVDAAGNASEPVKIKYNRDSEVPTGEISIAKGNLTEEGYLKGSIVVLTELDGTGSDLKPANIYLVKDNNGADGEKHDLSDKVTKTGLTTINTTKYPNGKYVIRVDVEDQLGNKNTITKDVTIANKLPAAKVTTKTKEDKVRFTYDFEDNKEKIAKVQYRASKTEEWKDADSEDESFEVEVPEEGKYTYYLRGLEQDDISTNVSEVKFANDKTKPEVKIDKVKYGRIYGTIKDENLTEWEVSYKEEGSEEDPKAANISGTENVNDGVIGILDSSISLDENKKYEIILTAKDVGDNTATYSYVMEVGDETLYTKIIEPAFNIERPGYAKRPDMKSYGVSITKESFNIEGEDSILGGKAYQWYVDNAAKEKDYSLKLNLAEDYNDKLAHDILATLEEGEDIQYSSRVTKNDELKNITGDGKGSLNEDSGKKIVSYRVLSTSEKEGTYEVTVGDSKKNVELGETYYISKETNYAKAYEDGKITLEVTGTNADADTFLAIDTIDEESFTVSELAKYLPENLACDNKLNDRTYLYFDNNLPSEDGSLSYNVYRSTEENFMPSEETLAAENIKAGYYSEMNVNYKTKYYYKLTVAKRNEEGVLVEESIPSEEVSGTILDGDEITKRLGLSEKYSYTSIDTSAGSGNVEESEGNFVYTEEDAILPNENLKIGLTRTYNSQSSEHGSFGLGWTNNMDMELLNYYDEDSEDFTNLAFKDGTGKIVFFTTKKDGSYVSTEGEYLALTKEDKTETITVEDRKAGDYSKKQTQDVEITSSYTMHSSDGTEYRFNSGGQLVYAVESNGSHLVFTHDNEFGRLIKVTTEKGLSINLSYKTGNDSLLVDQVELPDGSVRKYSYTKRLFSSDVLLTGVKETGKDGLSRSVKYSYTSEEDQKLDCITDAEGADYRISYAGDAVSKVLYPNDEGYKFKYKDGVETTHTEISHIINGDKTVSKYSGEYGKNTGYLKTRIDSDGNESTYGYTDGILTETSYTISPREIAEDGSIVSGGHVTKTVKTNLGDVRETRSEVSEDGTTTTYTYDSEEMAEQGLPSREVTKASNGSVISDFSYKYDKNGNETYCYDAVEDRSEQTTYDENGEMKSFAEYKGKDTSSPISKTTYDVSYDESGYRTEKETSIDWNDGSQMETVTISKYDMMGNCYYENETVCGSLESKTERKYDGLGRMVSAVSEDVTTSTTASYSYNKNDQLLSEEYAVTSKDDGTVTHSSTNYTYDSVGRKVTEKTKDQIKDSGYENHTYTTSYDYTDVSVHGDQPSKDRTYRNVLRISEKDDTGYVTGVVYQNDKGQTVRSKSGGVYSDYIYDDCNIQIGTYVAGINPKNTEGQLSLSVYDKDGYVTANVANPEAGGISYKIGEETIVEKYKYDGKGRVASQTDPLGNKLSYSYDSKDNLSSVTLPDGSTTKYETSESGSGSNLRQTVTTEDANGHISKSIYNESGDILEVRDIGDDESSDIYTIYSYDKKGRLTSEKEASGNEKRNTFDKDDKITKTEYFDKNGNLNKYSTYEYDVNDKVTKTVDYSVTDGNVVIDCYRVMTYDRQGRVLAESTVNGDGKTENEPSKEELDNNKITYSYNKDGTVKSVKYAVEEGGVSGVDYTYDSEKRLVKMSDAGKLLGGTIRTIEYDDFSRVSTVKDYYESSASSDYVERTYTYDDLNRVTEVVYTDSKTDKKVEGYQYSYDKNSNITQEISETSYTSGGEGLEITTKNYTYDKNGRLVKVSCGNEAGEVLGGEDGETSDASETHTYAYDAVGNRLEDRDGSAITTYNYNALDQLLDKTTKDGDEVTSKVSYTYDKNGNRLTEKDTETGDETYMTYDVTDMMTGYVKKEDGTTVETQTNVYNGDGQRIRKTDVYDKIVDIGADSEDETEKHEEVTEAKDYYYQGDSVLYTRKDHSKVDTFNILDLGGTAVSTVRADADIYYVYNRDIRGSVTSIAGSDGRSVATYEYDEYGNITSQTGDFENELTYTGQVYDEATGLYYCNARYYDASTGSFTTQDTYRGNIGNPGTLNYYTYCAGDPINNTDPTGHSIKSLWSKAKGFVSRVVKKTKSVAKKHGAPQGKAVESKKRTKTAKKKANTVVKKAKKKNKTKKKHSLKKKIKQGLSAIGNIASGAGASFKELGKSIAKQYKKEYAAAKESLIAIRASTGNSRAGTGKLSWLTRNKNAKVAKVGSAASKIGKVNIAITAITSGADLYIQYNNDINSGVSRKRANSDLGVNAAFELGEIGAGAAGAAIGAKAGAILGSVVPGLGNAVGAVVGAGLGVLGACIAQSYFENRVEDKYKQDVQDYVYSLNN